MKLVLLSTTSLVCLTLENLVLLTTKWFDISTLSLKLASAYKFNCDAISTLELNDTSLLKWTFLLNDASPWTCRLDISIIPYIIVFVIWGLPNVVVFEPCPVFLFALFPSDWLPITIWLELLFAKPTVSKPIKILYLPVVFVLPAFVPIPILYEPVVLFGIQFPPITVLFEPSEFLNKDFIPIAVFEFPLAFTGILFLPIAVL